MTTRKTKTRKTNEKTRVKKDTLSKVFKLKADIEIHFSKHPTQERALAFIIVAGKVRVLHKIHGDSVAGIKNLFMQAIKGELSEATGGWFIARTEKARNGDILLITVSRQGNTRIETQITRRELGNIVEYLNSVNI